MNKILFTAAITIMCLFLSCKDTTSTSSTNTDQNAKNLESNLKVLKAIETGDSATINMYVTSDAVDHSGPNGMEIKGPDAVRHMLVDMHNHMKDLKLEKIADAANGDYIFSLSRFSGTCTDGTMGMPAGTKMDEKGVDVIKVKEGKMVEHWSFTDPAAMMKHMQEMGGDHAMKDSMAH